MKGVYTKECACDLIESGGAVDNIVVLKFKNDKDACKALLKLGKEFHCGGPSSAVGTDLCFKSPPCHWHAGKRNWSIHGPGGHLMKVTV
jgi:hypothetical protein